MTVRLVKTIFMRNFIVKM